MQISQSLILPWLLALVRASIDHSVQFSDISNIQTLRRDLNSSSGSTCGCQLLSNLFPSETSYPLDLLGNYLNESTHYWDLREDLGPRCVFVPNNASDVAKGVMALKSCNSPFAVRGAGHMPVKGAANIDDSGVLVGLSAFQNIIVNAAENTVDVGPGLDWYDVNVALEPYGKVVVGGRLKTIGVAGLTLGGGIHYFNNKYGFSMDNVAAYEVVTGQGEVLNATASENSDLFWALKGGSNNFGIVTKFTLKTYDIPLVSTQSLTYTEDKMPAFLKATSDLANFEEENIIAAGGIITTIYIGALATILPAVSGVQEGSVSPPSHFQNFSAIPSLTNSTNVETIAQWTSTLDTPYQISRNQFSSHSVTADAESLLEMYEIFKAALPEVADVVGLISTFVTQPIQKSGMAVAANNGIGNTWSLDDSKAYVFWLVEAMWTLETDDERMLAWVQSTTEAIHSHNLAKGVGQDFIYLNDAADYQKPFDSIPAENLDKMKSIRAKYDPDLVFRKLCSGGYKLD